MLDDLSLLQILSSRTGIMCVLSATPVYVHNLHTRPGVVGWCEGAVYLTSPGRPTDIGLQLGKACYP